jgi:predicted chitinase
MDAVFPITQRNGEPYHTLSDFTKLFDQVKSGRYLLGQGYGWHSGVHLTSKMVPWGKGLRPIQAMMDGKIVAYRIHADYQTTTYKDQELKYSNNFVLLEHEYKNPEKDDEVFKLYSLYMHLAPPSDIGANSSLTTRYKLVDDGWNVRTFKLGGDPKKGQVESKVSMSSGTVLEYLHAEEQETVKFEIGDHTYKMIKCRVVQLGDSPSSSEKKMKGKIVWFAAGKDSDFDILNDTSVMIPEPVSEPEWMSKNAASLRDGSVVTLGLPLPLNIDFGAIEVKAGDELGYMGLHEYSNDAHATKKEDNRVHIELFSVEKPPEFFLKKIAPKNAEESPLITIDGSGSDGALSVSNAFYSQLLEELSKGEEVDFSAFKPREAKVYLENKRKHFERVIAKHPSDWYTDVTKDSYSMIHQLAKEVMDEKYMTGFVSEKDYLESPWRSEVMNHHDMFSQHERERADKFSWMQDTQSKITLPDDKSVWHYWPFVAKQKSNCLCHETLTAKHLKHIVSELRKSEDINSTELFNDSRSLLNEQDRTYEKFADSLNNCFKKYNIDSCIRKIHFLAQTYHETDRFRSTVEYSGTRKSYSPYYGRGLMQLTHKSSGYLNYEAYLNEDIMGDLDKVGKRIDLAVDSAGWFWSEGKKLSNSNTWKPISSSDVVGSYSNEIEIPKTKVRRSLSNGKTISYGTFSFNILADSDYTDVISYLVNGGRNGLSERREYVAKLKEIFKFDECNNVR